MLPLYCPDCSLTLSFKGILYMLLQYLNMLSSWYAIHSLFKASNTPGAHRRERVDTCI